MSTPAVSGASGYPDYESMMCVPPPPEEQVCQAEPSPPPKPKPPKDRYKTTAPISQSTAPAYSFLDPEELVCKPPAVGGAQLPRQEHLGPGLFTATLSNSKIVAELDLDLTDRNGFNNRGANDLTGQIREGSIGINRSLFDSALLGLKGTVQRNEQEKTTTSVQDVRFDSREKAYVFNLKVEKKVAFGMVPLWDHFQVKFQVNDQGQLVAQLADNWMPDAKILDKLEATIRDKLRQKVPPDYRNFRLDLERQGSQLKLVPELKQLEIPIGEHGAAVIQQVRGEQARFQIDSIGNLQIKLQGVPLTGSSGPAPVANAFSEQQADTAQLKFRFGLGLDNQAQMHVRGSGAMHLSEAETAGIKLGHENLGRYFQSGTFANDFSLYMHHKPGSKPSLESRHYVTIPDAQLGDHKTHLATAFQLNYNPLSGLSMEPIEPEYAPLDLKTSPNGVELMVNGPEYFPQMKALINQAKESIDLETYQLHDDASGREVAYLLARKAAGISPDRQAVPVRFIFGSWKGDLADGQRSEQVIKDARQQVEREIDRSRLSPQEKTQAKQRLHTNLQWKLFAEGVVRTDHRKVLVVDGAQATVGGMNIGDKYLSRDSYHDVMLKIAGPKVRSIHREFLENWYEFNHLNQPGPGQWDSLLKSEDELERRLADLQAKGQYRHTSQLGVLVTDDRQTDIEQGLVKVINEARNEINIEQAFFSDTTINRHLSEAVRNGVTVNVVLAKDSIIELFNEANLDSIRTLIEAKQQGGKGQVKLFYYDRQGGRETGFIHAKVLTADGQRAIVGSANMIGRSLSSPFAQISPDGTVSQTLYNKELSVFVEDPKLVGELNSRLFGEDMVHHSKEMSLAEIKQLIAQAGGIPELRKKALMALFT